MLEPRVDDSVRFEFSRASTFARMADVRMTLIEVFFGKSVLLHSKLE